MGEEFLEPKIVSFFNFKGGQGKTTLAVNYCRYISGCYITNEPSVSIRNVLSEAIPEEQFLIMGFNDDISTVFKTAIPRSNGRIIVDFGGYADARLETIIKHSDVVCIPCAYEGSLDLALLAETIETCKAWNQQNCIIVLNNIENDDLHEIRETVKLFYSKTYKIAEVRRSRFVRRLLKKGELFGEISERGALKKPLSIVLGQLTAFFETIEASLNKED